MVTPEMLALLDALGANQKGRGGRTLLDHLEGTRAILAGWGCPTEVCLAGLFHSVYGAEGGRARARDANLDRRNDVRALIGAGAEELAYLYAACERRTLFETTDRAGAHGLNDLFDGREVAVSEATLRSLLTIEAANLVEGPVERIDWPESLLATVARLWERAQAFVSPHAHAQVVARLRAIDEHRAGTPR